MFDGGTVGEEACRYGPDYFIISGLMNEFRAWQERSNTMFCAFLPVHTV